MFLATLRASDKCLDLNYGKQVFSGAKDSFLALRCAQYVHLALPRFNGLILTKVFVLTVFVAVVAASLAHVCGALNILIYYYNSNRI